jgi:small subunit ribosomal protein S4
MGDPKKQRKRYATPKQLFDVSRIEEEKNLTKKYGLKNRREIWIAAAKLKKFRDQAKKLILKPEQQNDFILRLNKLGLIEEKATIDDVLALDREKILSRRFQTIVFEKKVAKSIKEARQLIAHRKIKIGDKVCDVPGRLITIEEENQIKIK